jgi:hypothetical protein
VDQDITATDDDGRFNFSHRALDAQRTAQNLFNTPCFNRSMRHQGSDASSVPASLRGLGQMHFIRSVLDHHREGGDSEDIERLYQQLEQYGSPADWSTG